MISEDDMNSLYEFYYSFNVPSHFQVVARLDGMRFIIHSNENCGHHKGHIHIESSGAEVEIDLQTCEIINMSGNMNKHKVKTAQEYVRSHQALFINNWNEFSNGITISP